MYLLLICTDFCLSLLILQRVDVSIAAEVNLKSILHGFKSASKLSSLAALCELLRAAW